MTNDDLDRFVRIASKTGCVRVGLGVWETLKGLPVADKVDSGLLGIKIIPSAWLPRDAAVVVDNWPEIPGTHLAACRPDTGPAGWLVNEDS